MSKDEKIYKVGEPGWDRGLLCAEACFETLRVINGDIFDWPAHESRLRHGLQEFGIALPSGLKEFCLAEAAGQGRDVLVRLTVSGGTGPWGLLPAAERHACVHIRAMPYTAREKPVRLRSADWPFPLKPRPAKFTADYAECLRAMHRLQNDLQDGEEALICQDDLIYSGIAANVMLYRGGQWWTPPTGDGVLPGVVRKALLAAGCVHESVCPRTWLQDCDAMTLSNSGAFIQVVAGVDGRTLAISGALFDQLWQALAGQAGIPEH